MPSESNLEMRYSQDQDQLCRDHERIIEQILEEEESLISNHRSHIDEIVSIVKDEMNILNIVDKPNSDVDQYV